MQSHESIIDGSGLLTRKHLVNRQYSFFLQIPLHRCPHFEMNGALTYASHGSSGLAEVRVLLTLQLVVAGRASTPDHWWHQQRRWAPRLWYKSLTKPVIHVIFFLRKMV